MMNGSSSSASTASKGKLKDFNPDFDDLNPLITYRHLQSPIIGPKHPLRVIALCDCNAFYANCEQVRLGLDPEVPLVVLQWGMLIAVNYPARRYGISRMDKLEDARKRCPDVMVIHVATYAEGENEPKYWENPDIKTHKISLDLYRRESVKIQNLLKEQLPTGEVEKASIDEVFIDFSIPVRDILLERYPHLTCPPPDSSGGLDTPLPPPPRISNVGLGNLIPIDPSKFDSEKDVTTELVEEIEKDQPITWHDIALTIAAELMAKMRGVVHKELGYLTSAGISRNKFLSKLAASYRKFNTQNILRNSAIPGFLKPMPFQKIRFLGGKLGKALATEYDVSTVGDLLSISLDEMQAKFGECSVWVYEILRGIDRSEVKEKASVNKSMNASKNLHKPVTKASEGPHWIRMLASELSIRLNEAREQTPGLWPRTISLHIRQGWSVLRSKQQPFPPPRTNVTVDFVTDEGIKLWNEIVGNDMLWNGKGGMKITHLSLSLSGIQWTEDGQQNIQGFFRSKPLSSSEHSGSEIVAGPSNAEDRRNTKPRSKTRSTSDDNVQKKAIVAFNAKEESSRFSFECTRCHKFVSVPSKLRSELETMSQNAGLNADVESILEDVLSNLRREHNDYHFAQEIARQDSLRPISSSSGRAKSKAVSPPRESKQTRKRKRDTPPQSEDITKYFKKTPRKT